MGIEDTFRIVRGYKDNDSSHPRFYIVPLTGYAARQLEWLSNTERLNGRKEHWPCDYVQANVVIKHGRVTVLRYAPTNSVEALKSALGAGQLEAAERIRPNPSLDDCTSLTYESWLVKNRWS